MAIKNLIFDIGEVLIGYDSFHMMKRFGLSDEDAMTFERTFFPDPLWREFDLGNVPFEDVVDRFAEKFPSYAECFRWMIRHAEQMPVYRPKIWQQIHVLKEQGYHLYLLSNYSRTLFEKHLHHASFLKDMDGEVISWQVHIMKPEEGIYQALLQKYDLRAEECTFFDDKKENVETAKRLGMTAFQVTGEEQLYDLLKQCERDRYLEQAIRYEKEHAGEILTEERPAYHLTPLVGWMNDPNGFSVYQGKYHLFYQYYPYDNHWGPMHWGHAVSLDLLHWDYLPVAIAPDQWYDRDGCFSGSAIELADGKQLLMYTSVDRTPTSEGTLVDRQTQSLAVGDGVSYQKLPNNPVLDDRDLPEGCSIADFRDPKLVRMSDGTYRCYCVTNMPKNGGGALLQFRSEDGFSWKYGSTMLENRGKYGKMWECPDFFELDGRSVFLTSPQDMEAKGLEFENGDGNLWMSGSYSEESGIFTPVQCHSVDYGTDFYAHQTVLSEDGRRIMIAWMQNWDSVNLRTVENRWYGQMTTPRELFFRGDRLCQSPIRELDACRTEKIEYKDIMIYDDMMVLDGIDGRILDMEIEISMPEETDPGRTFGIQMAADGDHHTDLIYQAAEDRLTLDRTYSGTRRAVLNRRTTNVRQVDEKLKLRILLDRYSVEVFVNDGEKAMTMTLETDQAADGICFYSKGAASFSVTKYTLKI